MGKQKKGVEKNVSKPFVRFFTKNGFFKFLQICERKTYVTKGIILYEIISYIIFIDLTKFKINLIIKFKILFKIMLKLFQIFLSTFVFMMNIQKKIKVSIMIENGQLLKL